MRVDEGPKDPLPRDEVRRRILAGNYRRREAKKGTIKRLIGNCSNILATACFFTAMAAVSAGGLFKQVMCGDSRPDVIEIFAGTAEVSLHMARRGWNVSEPVDIVFGSDLRDSVVRDDIKDFLRTLISPVSRLCRILVVFGRSFLMLTIGLLKERGNWRNFGRKKNLSLNSRRTYSTFN